METKENFIKQERLWHHHGHVEAFILKSESQKNHTHTNP